MSCISFIYVILQLFLRVFFHRLHNHPHSNQHRFQRLNQSENPAGSRFEVHPCLLTSHVEIGVILFAEREGECGDVIITAEVILLNLVRTSAETLLWTIRTPMRLSLLHAAP